MKNPPRESEIKIPVTDLEHVRRRAAEVGAELVHPMARERNLLLDTAQKSLTEGGETLRIRSWGEQSMVTFKGPASYRGPIKIREELETNIGDPELIEAIFLRLGYQPSVRYEKDRESWRLQGAIITLDHTPMGDFVEIEGPEEDLQDLANHLQLDVDQAVEGSYVSLWQSYRLAHGLGPDMLFDE